MADKDFDTLKADVAQVMSTASGRAIIWEILSMCGIYTDNATDANQGIEGKRSIGIQILGLLEDTDPKIYPNLLITKQEEENDRRNKN